MPNDAETLAIDQRGVVTYGGKSAKCVGNRLRAAKWFLGHLTEASRRKVSSFERTVWPVKPSRVLLRQQIYQLNLVLAEVGYPGRVLLCGDWLEVG